MNPEEQVWWLLKLNFGNISWQSGIEDVGKKPCRPPTECVIFAPLPDMETLRGGKHSYSF